jgi:parallel beta-helix repeat protein
MLAFILLLGLFVAAVQIQSVKSSGTIYIRADGSIDPSTAPISSVDNVTYTFTDNIYDEIVGERDNMIIDGAGYTVQGMETGSGNGILLSGRKNVTIRNVQIKGFLRGIYCYESSNDTISGNNITNNRYGIHFASSSGSSIVANNLVANDPCGIYFWPTSDFNSMIGNNITSGGYGILMYGSSNSICNNNITDHSYGIAFAYCSNNRISGNAFRGCGIHLGLPYGNIVEGNSVNGKPLVFLEDMSDYTVDNAGQVILVRCNNIRVENLNLSDTTIGLELWETNNSRVSNNNITANKVDGIFLLASSNNTIEGNNVTGNLGHGINFYSSSYNTLRDNNLTDNVFSILVEGPDLLHFVNDIDTSNTVNGRPIYYWIDQTEKTIPSDAGYVALVNCTNITVHNLDLRKNAGAVLLVFTANSTITRNNMTANDIGINLINSTNNSICDNDLTNNYSGILLRDSSNDNIIEDNNMTGNYYSGIVISSSSCNTISRNNVTNNWHGIVMKSSSNNSIYHNNFFDNSHLYTYDSTNIWDDGYPSGGNYWSDYTERYPDAEELDGSGIWNTPYVIDADNIDHYPLMLPCGAPLPQTYNLTITATAGGTTYPAPGTYSYTADSQVQVTAIPYANYFFDYWELDSVNLGSANPYTILMDEDHALKAVFSPVTPPLSASISPLLASINTGQSVTFTSTVNGGKSPYGYQWYLDGSSASPATLNSWTYTPSNTGIHYVYLKVTDAGNNIAQSETARITAATVPVGGYSYQIQVQPRTEPLLTYIALMGALTVVFTKLKPKTKRKR